MPLNGTNSTGKPVARPPWMKDAKTEPAAAPAKPSWANRNLNKVDDGAKSSSSSPAKSLPSSKESTPQKEVTAKLQSREIKVPFTVERTKPAPTPLKKYDKPESKTPEPKVETKLNVRQPAKTPDKSPSKTPERNSKTPDSHDSFMDTDEDETESDESEEESSEEESSEEESAPVAKKPPVPKVVPKVEPVKVAPAKKAVLIAEKSEPDTKRATSPDHTFKKPELRKIMRQKSTETKVKERTPSPEPKFFKTKLRKVPSSLRERGPMKKEKLPTVDLKKAPPKPEAEVTKTTEQFPHKPSILLSASSKKIPPPPPPPPPPPMMKPPPGFEKKPISTKHKEVLEKLKTRPRKRPDWSEMMKEVEDSNRKLKHVECNDRSQPILTCKSVTKESGQFIYETEKANAHNQLLNQINAGVRLKSVKTNDRSKPILAGLRKFRRQMTIEEQILKSESRAVFAEAPKEESEDELDDLDDIDKVRDDLQSTKQMLALELRNKEATDRENKRLLARVQNLEAELARERWTPMSNEPLPESQAPDAGLIRNLKAEAEEAQKQSQLLEKKFQAVADELDKSHKEVEEQKRQIAALEKKLQNQGQGIEDPYRRQSEVPQKEDSPELEMDPEEDEIDENETEEQKAERLAKRLSREVQMLETKLTRLKEKEGIAKAERQSLKDQMKKNNQLLKCEKKKYKKLQKEVEKMADMMKEEESDKSEDEEDEEEEESESEESDESEGSESESESEAEADDAGDQEKKINLEPRVKRHDGRFSSLKKGNYLLQTNVEALKDEISKQKDACTSLQADLDSVIFMC